MEIPWELRVKNSGVLWSLAKETGKDNDILRHPGEDSVYEKDKMDKLGL